MVGLLNIFNIRKGAAKFYLHQPRRMAFAGEAHGFVCGEFAALVALWPKRRRAMRTLRRWLCGFLGSATNANANWSAPTQVVSFRGDARSAARTAAGATGGGPFGQGGGAQCGTCARWICGISRSRQQTPIERGHALFSFPRTPRSAARAAARATRLGFSRHPTNGACSKIPRSRHSGSPSRDAEPPSPVAHARAGHGIEHFEQVGLVGRIRVDLCLRQHFDPVVQVAAGTTVAFFNSRASARSSAPGSRQPDAGRRRRRGWDRRTRRGQESEFDQHSGRDHATGFRARGGRIGARMSTVGFGAS